MSIQSRAFSASWALHQVTVMKRRLISSSSKERRANQILKAALGNTANGQLHKRKGAYYV
jgi:hypothetical protein